MVKKSLRGISRLPYSAETILILLCYDDQTESLEYQIMLECPGKVNNIKILEKKELDKITTDDKEMDTLSKQEALGKYCFKN